MKYEIERLKGQVKFTFEVDAKEWDEQINHVYLKTKNKYNVQGFRRGHATRKMIEMAYGENVFFEDAFNNCVTEGYNNAIDEHEDIFPVEQPHIEIEKFDGKNLTFTALVTVKPEVKLGVYTDLEIPKSEYSVTEAEVDKELEGARERLSRLIEITDREVKNGDMVNLDYCGKIDGVTFDGGTAKDQKLVIGSGTFIPGFEEQMVGMKLGETKDLNVKFPDNYGAENLAGKDAVFTVTVNKIFYKELPELNDEFASNASKFETLKDYKDDIKKRLTEEKESRAKVIDENSLIDAVVKNAEVDIPECMIENQIDYIVQDFEYKLAYLRGIKLDDYLKYIDTDIKTFREQRKPEAENAVKTRLVMEQIIKEQNIEINDDDYNKKVSVLAEQAKQSEEEFTAKLNDNQKDYIRREALMDKAVAYLESQNKFVKVKKTAAAKKSDEVKSENKASESKSKKSSEKKTTEPESEQKAEEKTEKPKKPTTKKTTEPKKTETKPRTKRTTETTDK